jgi:hypothetical protein
MLKGKDMTINEIRKEYPNEWVLIEYRDVDAEFNVAKGDVVAHSPVKEEIYKVLVTTKGKNIAIEYTGRIPEDLAVMF